MTDPLARSVWDLEPLEGVSPDSALERCDIRVIGPDAPGLMELLLGPVVKTGEALVSWIALWSWSNFRDEHWPDCHLQFARRILHGNADLRY